MAAFTTTQAGDWSDGATWVGGVAPNLAGGDTATVDHAVEVDVNAIIDGLTINANLTVADDVSLTLAGNCTQGDAEFILGSGSGLIFDCTAADRKWLQGTDDNQLNCYVKSVATANPGDVIGKPLQTTGGNHSYITKIGSNHCWFDGGDEGTSSIVNTTGWDLAYCEVSDIGTSDGTMASGLNQFGNQHLKISYCTFDNCATWWLNHAVTWNADSNMDWIQEYCRWTNSPAGSANCRSVVGGTGSGTLRFGRNVYDKQITLGLSTAFTIEGCIFRECPAMNGAQHDLFSNCLVRIGINDHTLSPRGNMLDCYMLADHRDPADPVNGTNDVGNPHFIQSGAGAWTFDGLVFEYTRQLLIDGGDGIFGSQMTSGTIIRCLVIPSPTDGYASTNITNPVEPGFNDMALEHNTIAGRTAHLTLIEYDVSDNTRYRSVKSNLLASPITAVDLEKAAFIYDIGVDETENVDTIDPAEFTHNYIHNPVSYINPTNDDDFPGHRGRYSAEPAGPTIVTTGEGFATGPAFVDPTRCFENWAVFMDAAGSGDSQIEKITAGLDLLSTDPTLVASSLIPWVRAGFAPTNTDLRDGHDGQTIGAIQGAFPVEFALVGSRPFMWC